MKNRWWGEEKISLGRKGIVERKMLTAGKRKLSFRRGETLGK